MTRAPEVKRILTRLIREVENALLQDMSDVFVDESWSRISDPHVHLEHIRTQLESLKKAISDKQTGGDRNAK